MFGFLESIVEANLNLSGGGMDRVDSGLSWALRVCCLDSSYLLGWDVWSGNLWNMMLLPVQ